MKTRTEKIEVGGKSQYQSVDALYLFYGKENVEWLYDRDQVEVYRVTVCE